MMYKNMCVKCGKKFVAKTKVKKYCSKQCRQEALSKPFPRQSNRSKQPCWHCQNATGGCSWSRELKPVEGWDAIPTVIKSRNSTKEEDLRSYKIISCPQYVGDVL